MDWLRRVDTFLRSENGLQFWRDMDKVYLVLSAIGIPIVLILTWQLLRVGRRYQAARKNLEKFANFPGMEDLRHLYKPLLKKHGIHIENDNSLT